MVYMVVELCSLARRQPRTVKDQLDIVASPMIGIISSNWLETTRIVRWPPASKYETSLQNESSLKYHWKMYEISTVLADNIGNYLLYSKKIITEIFKFSASRSCPSRAESTMCASQRDESNSGRCQEHIYRATILREHGLAQ